MNSKPYETLSYANQSENKYFIFYFQKKIKFSYLSENNVAQKIVKFIKN